MPITTRLSIDPDAVAAVEHALGEMKHAIEDSLIEPQNRVIRDTPRRMRLPVDFEYITLDRKQTAKMIRADLKKRYPDTTFSVRPEMMSGGYTCVRVTWNGEAPHQDEVRAFLAQYEGAVSDDSGDGVDPVVTQIEGRWYRFDVDYLSVNRYDDTPEVIDGQARVIVPKLAEGSADV